MVVSSIVNASIKHVYTCRWEICFTDNIIMVLYFNSGIMIPAVCWRASGNVLLVRTLVNIIIKVKRNIIIYYFSIFAVFWVWCLLPFISQSDSKQRNDEQCRRAVPTPKPMPDGSQGIGDMQTYTQGGTR